MTSTLCIHQYLSNQTLRDMLSFAAQPTPRCTGSVTSIQRRPELLHMGQTCSKRRQRHSCRTQCERPAVVATSSSTALPAVVAAACSTDQAFRASHSHSGLKLFNGIQKHHHFYSTAADLVVAVQQLSTSVSVSVSHVPRQFIMLLAAARHRWLHLLPHSE